MTAPGAALASCVLLFALTAVAATPGGVLDRRRSAIAPRFAARLQRERRALPNLLAFGYTAASFATGFALVAGPFGAAWLAGAALLAHAMIAAHYLEHECVHSLVARSRSRNVALGTLLGWLTGRIYFRFADLARLHLDHHRSVCDFEGFALAEFVSRHRATLFGRLVLGLEALHVPALHFVIRGHGLRVALRPGRAERRRTLAVMAARVAVAALLAALAPGALAGYLIAYLVYVQVARFVDAFQHAYPELRRVPPGGGRRDRLVEQSLTFSFPLAYRLRFLNTLLINFGYHSAHHAFTACPWYDLPAVHDALLGDPELRGRRVGLAHRASLWTLLRFYHHHRLTRLSRDQGTAWRDDGALSFHAFYGAVADKLGFIDPELSE